MFPFVAAALRRLNEAGCPVIVVTNQSGVARGYVRDSWGHELHQLMMQQLSKSGARIDAIYYCPHTPSENCNCRKPRTGMLEQAARERALDLRRSFVVGDRHADVELARNAHARSVLVRPGSRERGRAWHRA